MIREYAGILHKVRILAESRSIEAALRAKKASPENFGLINPADIDVNEKPDHSGLREYLMAQDMKTLEVIQAAMYIGRDYSPFSEGDFDDMGERDEDGPGPGEVSQDPDKLLLDWMNEKVKDLNPDKAAEVQLIYEKLPLNIYLKRAFTILGI